MDPEFLQKAADILPTLGTIGGGSAGIKILERLFRVQPGDIPVCQTRVMRSGRGLPWDKLIAIHPLQDGRIEMKAVEIAPPPSSEA